MDYEFDIFLSYNSNDSSNVKKLAHRLEVRGIKVYYDKGITPGDNWVQMLEKGIESSASGAVIIGNNDFSEWEKREHSALISKEIPIIPVILPGVSSMISLPPFLATCQWVDMRSGFSEEAINSLLMGITKAKDSKLLNVSGNEIGSIYKSGYAPALSALNHYGISLRSIYLLVSDFDGVVLNSDKYVDAETLFALRDYTDQGNLLVIASGRAFRYIEQFYRLLHLTTPVIVYNGAGIYDPTSDMFVYNRYLDSDEIMRIKDVFSRLKNTYPGEKNQLQLSWDVDDYLTPLREYSWVAGVRLRERRVNASTEFISKIPERAHRLTLGMSSKIANKELDYINELISDYSVHRWVQGAGDNELHVFDLHNRGASKYEAFRWLRANDPQFSEKRIPQDRIYFALEGKNDSSFLDKDLQICLLNNADTVLSRNKDVMLIPFSNNESGLAEIIYTISGKYSARHPEPQRRVIISFKICNYKTYKFLDQRKWIINLTNMLQRIFNNEFALVPHVVEPLGDGFVVALDFSQYNDEVRSFEFVEQLINSLQDENGEFPYAYRVAVNDGTVSQYVGADGALHLMGKGLNDTNRILEFAGDRHVLVGHSLWNKVCDHLCNKPNFQYKSDTYLGHRDEFGVEHHFDSVYDDNGFGNSKPINSTDEQLICKEFRNTYEIVGDDHVQNVRLHWDEEIVYPTVKNYGSIPFCFKYETKGQYMMEEYSVELNGAPIAFSKEKSLLEAFETRFAMKPGDTVHTHRVTLMPLRGETRKTFFVEFCCQKAYFSYIGGRGSGKLVIVNSGSKLEVVAGEEREFKYFGRKIGNFYVEFKSN